MSGVSSTWSGEERWGNRTAFRSGRDEDGIGTTQPVVGTSPAAAQLGQNVRVDSATRGTRGVRSPAVVTWTDGFIAAPSPASDAMVRAAEGELRVHLPADFLAVAQVHQGAQP